MRLRHQRSHLFFFNDPATTEISPLSLHDALPISPIRHASLSGSGARSPDSHVRPHARPVFTESMYNEQISFARARPLPAPDRKSTRLNSSHQIISYAVFCLKKKKKASLSLLKSVS